MAAARVGRGWVQAGLVWDSGANCLGHGIVDFEDHALGAVLAPLLLISAPCDGKGVHNVGHGVARCREVGLELGQTLYRFTLRRPPVAINLCGKVKVKEGGVQFTAKHKAACIIPAKGWCTRAAVLSKRREIPCCVAKFQDSRCKERTVSDLR